MRRCFVAIAVTAALVSVACGGATRRGSVGDEADKSGPAVVRGRVQFADGTAPAQFVVSGSFTREPRAFADGTGTFEIVLDRVTRGPHFVVVSGPDFAHNDFCDAPATFELQRGVVRDLGTIVVERGATIRGRVIAADGRPVPNVTVIGGLLPYVDLTEMIVTGAVPLTRGVLYSVDQSTRTAADGTFELTGLRGPGALVAFDDEGRLAWPVPLADAATGAPIELMLGEGGRLEGVVTGATPPVKTIIWAAAAGTGVTFITHPEPDGRFRFRRLPPGEYELRQPTVISATPVRATVVDGGATRIDLDVGIHAPVTVRARVAPGAHPILVVTPGAADATGWAELDATLATLDPTGLTRIELHQGALTLERFAPGEYTACAASREGEPVVPAPCAKHPSPAADAHVTCRRFTVAVGSAPMELELEVPAP